MTQQQILEEFRTFPKAQKSLLIRQLLQIFEEELQENERNKHDFSREERKAAVERLRGAAKTENPPMTKEEVREDYYNYLAEKYK